MAEEGRVLLREKLKDISGTFHENPFLVSLLSSSEGEIRAPLFDGLPVHTVTHLGNYGESYLPFFPIVLLELPPLLSLSSLSSDSPFSLPSNLLNAYFPKRSKQDDSRKEEELITNKEEKEEIECYFIIHSEATRGPCQHFTCENENEFNLMFHPWVFRFCVFNELMTGTEMIEMGIFSGRGILPVHQDLKESESRGTPFENVEPRLVSIHNQCFSPANAQIQIDETKQIASFFSLGRFQNRKIITFHILPLSKQSEDLFSSSVALATNVHQLLEILNNISMKKKEFRESVHDLLSLLVSCGVVSLMEATSLSLSPEKPK